MASTNDVAVVIPCFNDGAFIEEAVASVRNQGLTDVIVVNDGSTDDLTRTALERLRTTIQVIDQPNQGPASARMRGVRETQKPLVLVLDADDRLAPDAAATMVAAIGEDERLAAVWGDLVTIGSGARRHPKVRTLDPWRITFVNELPSSALFRRPVLLEVGGWREGMPFEDWDLWMRLAACGYAGRHVGIVTLEYRVKRSSRYRSELSDYPARINRLQSANADLLAMRSSHRARTESGLPLRLLWSAIAKVPMPEHLERYLLFGALVLCEPDRRRKRLR